MDNGNFKKEINTNTSAFLLGHNIPTQECPSCFEIIGAIPGGRDAICKNCGYKDPCCE